MTNEKDSYYLADEKASQQFGCALALVIVMPARIYLRGSIGAGKTTVVRSLLRSLGVSGAIKSPSYALIEPYELAQGMIYHFDLYRISDPSELEYIAWRDYFSEHALCCVEWPEHAHAILPAPDIALDLTILTPGRQLNCQAFSAKGRTMLQQLKMELPCG